MKAMRTLAALWIVGVGVACASPGGTHPVGPDAISQTPTLSSQVTAETADVLVTQFEVATPVRVGQTVGLKPVRPGERWQVSFSTEALQLLTPADRPATPGDEGWVWKALAPGSVEILLTLVATCSQPPCGPNLLRTAIALEITGS